MSSTLDTKEQVLEAAITGVCRVAEAIVATPTEKRTKALDAAADSYRQTAQDLGYDEAEIRGWLHGIMFRLRTENYVSLGDRSVCTRVSATEQRAPR
jgi:hypothetical protein